MSESESAAEAGRKVRDRVFGAPKPGAKPNPTIELAPDLRRIGDEVVFGQIWTRPGLELWHRSMITMAALMAMGGKEPQLKAHIKGGLNVGMTREQVIEVITHLAFYCGLPAANNAMKCAKDAFNELDAEQAKG